MTLIRYIKNSRNNETLIAGEYIFRKNKSRDEKVYWKCRKNSCPAKITTYAGKVMGHYLRHNHDDNNQDEIARLEGLKPTTNFQVTQVDDEVSQQIITTGEPFGEYSFAVENFVVTSSGEPARRIDFLQDNTNGNTSAETTIVVTNAPPTTSVVSTPSASSSLSTIFKEFNESQKKIELLVTNLATTNGTDDLQTENMKLKLELDEAVRKFRIELENKEIQFQEEKNRGDLIQKELTGQLALERSEKERLEQENEKLREIVKQYELQLAEEEVECTISQVSDTMSC
ncbi:uncharacterized protein LOC107360095 [Tetranychus urticae]|uniref:FLYWCH-type domain-containing protein n=1 Tax=Tetranychus urticae TaxID=32264 RepID=T1K2X4_TETUR|nr:uncharacterized protein LOC107360095 [Tetranychus urticae]